MVFNGADGRCDSDDILLHGAPVAVEPDVSQRVVAHRAIHRSKIQLIDTVAARPQKRAHLAVQGPLAVEHDIRAMGLHEVGLHVMTCFAAPRTTQHQHVVVKAAFPSVGFKAGNARKQSAPTISTTGISNRAGRRDPSGGRRQTGRASGFGLGRNIEQRLSCGGFHGDSPL